LNEVECQVCNRLEISTGMAGKKLEEGAAPDRRFVAFVVALMIRNFVRVLAIRPLSEKQYIGCYGEGRM
jgi:hypothetical protein